MNQIGQIATEFQPLLNYGALGVGAWWMATQLSKRVDNVAHKLEGLTRALLVVEINREGAGHGREIARNMLAKLEADDSKK